MFLLTYITDEDKLRRGLQLAWSTDRIHWHIPAGENRVLYCDYGHWQREKKMLDPVLIRHCGSWHCVWSVNGRDPVLAHAASPDLVNWHVQNYYSAGTENFEMPVLRENGQIEIDFRTASGRFFRMKTADFKHYSEAVEIAPQDYRDPREEVMLPTGAVSGIVYEVSPSEIEVVRAFLERREYRQNLYQEPLIRELPEQQGRLVIDGSQRKKISDMLIGVFYEDLNYAADGGLYAELIQNRNFEYTPADREFQDPQWNSTYAWSCRGSGCSFAVETAEPLNAVNPHYAVLSTKTPGGALVNSGFDGIPATKNARYRFSLYARGKTKLEVALQSGDEKIASGTIECDSNQWTRYELELTAACDADCVLALSPLEPGQIALDFISLFPAETFCNRANGLRKDLAQAIADLKPKFMRFPGGCLVHGDGLGNIYNWKDSIGPVETRKGQRNIWGYHQSLGLGYFEYFQFCEDMGAAPLPVVAAGVCCQNSSCGGHGQQGGIPLDQMDVYIQDIFDLIEWANGPADSKWGSKRAAAGHPESFGFRYLGVGNEDLISDVFVERFTMIFEALKKRHPEIIVVGTAGPNSEGSDYMDGWALARKLGVPVVDEHYYKPPGWFIHNQDFYDTYDRKGPKVYLGEYATHLPENPRPNNLETALVESLYLAALERNGDVVAMCSYAPLLCNESHVQWVPDLIYFNHRNVNLHPSYYTQKLFSCNSGTEYICNQLSVNNKSIAVIRRIASSLVYDETTGEYILKLVNLLPSTVSLEVASKNLDLKAKTVLWITLTGNPEDEFAQPREDSAVIGQVFTITLKPFSLTILRFS